MSQQMPGGLSPDAYVERRLRPLDSDHYSAAGMLPYKRVGTEIQVLVAKEKPWNSLSQGFDPLAWNVFGGKRIPRQERTSATTAMRCFLETINVVTPTPDPAIIREVCNKSFALWYPMGKFALLMVDVTDKNGFDDLPDKFEAAKPKDGEFVEYYINELGIKKWRKNIDKLEWVSGSSLASSSEVSDLLENCIKLKPFVDFLKGEYDPDATLPQAPGDDQFAKNGDSGQQGGGGGWNKGGKGGKGGKAGKGSKGYGGKGGGWGQQPPWMKGGGGGGNMMMMQKGGQMPQQYNQMGGCGKGGAPAFFTQQQFQPTENSAEMQRQIYGEQLYLLVQPMSPSPYFAQKITGMLLELPENELMLNLTNTQELQRRVTEALEVLREDGLLQGQ